jgi:hypothetical protein
MCASITQLETEFVKLVTLFSPKSAINAVPKIFRILAKNSTITELGWAELGWAELS